MRRKLLFLLTAIILVVSLVLAGCQSGPAGVPQAEYDEVVEAYQTALGTVGDLNGQLADLAAQVASVTGQLETAGAELRTAQGRIAELEGQLALLSLTGETPAETAEKIVRYYHETHVYSSYDLFVCADMAAEVWNMLKAQGIEARIAVGDIDTPISSIVECNHSWVLAEIAPGEYLALETTGGYVVHEADNPLYYQGWYFDSPAEEKEYQNLIREYNVRVELRNDLAQEVNRAIAENNQVLYERLRALKEAQETILNNIHSQIESLATRCGS